MADTFCYAGSVRIRGVARTVASFYTGWAGRFSLHLAESLVGRLGPRACTYLPGAAVGVWLLSLTWVVAQSGAGSLDSARPWLGKRLATLLPALLLASLILFVTLDAIPLVEQSLYWSDAMSNYVPPLVLMTAYAGLVLWRRNKQGAQRGGALWLVVGASLTFAASGFSEMAEVLQVCALSSALLLASLESEPQTRESTVRLLAAGLAAAVVGLLIVVAAPGNRVRQAAVGPSPTPPRVVQIAVTQAWQFVVSSLHRGWTLIDYAGLVALGGLLGAGTLPEESAGVPWRAYTRVVFGAPALTLLLITGTFAAAAYGLAAAPPERALIAPQYALCCGIATWAFVVGRIGREARVGSLLGREALLWQGVAACTTIVFLLGSLTALHRTLAKQPQFAAYAKAWDARDVLLRAAKRRGVDRITVSTLQNPFGCGEVGPDPAWWVNQCASTYYGLTVVACAPPAPPTAREMAVMTRVDGVLGRAGRVLGYTVEPPVAATGKLVVTVYWQSAAPTDRPYTVFLHLYDAASGIIAQSDAEPRGGQYPTTAWAEGSVFADRHELALPTRPTALSASLLLGLYDRSTMERLPVSGQDADPDNRWIRLGQVQLAQQ